MCWPVSHLMLLQAVMTNAFQADQQLQRSAWLASLPGVPGPRGSDLETAMLACVSNTCSGAAPGQGWGLVSRPMINFAVAQLEKGVIKAAELADALSGIWQRTIPLRVSLPRNQNLTL